MVFSNKIAHNVQWSVDRGAIFFFINNESIYPFNQFRDQIRLISIRLIDHLVEQSTREISAVCSEFLNNLVQNYCNKTIWIFVLFPLGVLLVSLPSCPICVHTHSRMHQLICTTPTYIPSHACTHSNTHTHARTHMHTHTTHLECTDFNHEYIN